MPKIATFGEIMLRLAPPGHSRFAQCNQFEATYGGGEANVAVSAANFGLDAAFVTKLPDNDIGQCALGSLRALGVDTRHITRGGPRLGIYYIEKGASQRPSKVVYDRAGSSVALATRADFDWPAILDGVDWFHFTGITPALGGELPAICADACKAAKAAGAKVSCDLNFRKKLWTTEQAGKIMGDLMQYVDVCIANEEDAADVFGIHAENSDVENGALDRAAYESVAKKLRDRFGFGLVAITLRESLSASDNNWSGMLYDGSASYFSRRYSIRIVDRVGGGDSFGAGLIYAQLAGYDAQQSIEFAAAASCLKHTIEGDFNRVSVAEVLSLAGGNGSGRVQR